MAARARKSKKRSAANSSSRHEPTFFLDICLGREIVPAALRDAGLSVEIHVDHFSPDTPDAEWLPEVGRNGWVVLTKDSKLLTNQLQIIALLRANVPCFALNAANMTGDEMGQAFLTALPHMLGLLKKLPPPFVARVTRSGNVAVVATVDQIIRKVR